VRKETNTFAEKSETQNTTWKS